MLRVQLILPFSKLVKVIKRSGYTINFFFELLDILALTHHRITTKLKQ